MRTNPVSRSDFPHSPGEITAEWLTGVLRDGGVLASDAIESVDVRPISVDGFVGSHARVVVRYARRPSGAPESLFAKFPSENPAVRSGTHHLYEREVFFYREVAPQVALRIPRCYFAGIDAHKEHSLLLLEDFVSAQAGDILTGCPSSRVESLFRQIAVLHARYWQSPQLNRWTWLPGHDGDQTRRVERYRKAWPMLLERCAGIIPPGLVPIGERALGRVPDLVRALAACPATLTHGDFQLINLLFDHPDEPAIFVDWQTVQREPAAREIAMFLARSLPVEQRRADQERILRTYHGALLRAGVRDYAFDALLRDMRVGLLHGFLRVVSATVNLDLLSSERGKQMVAARLERCHAMMEDHDVRELLE